LTGTYATKEKEEQMATKSGSTSSRVVAAAKTRGRKVLGPKAISRLEKSLDAADVALKDLRKELGRGGSVTVKDFEKTLSDSRKNLRNLAKTVARDAEKVQKAATAGRSPRATSRSTSGTTRRSTSGTTRRSTSGTTRRSTSGSSRRSTASRASSAAKKTTGRSSGGAKSTRGRSTRSK
jgi:hypothetical protein